MGKGRFWSIGARDDGRVEGMEEKRQMLIVDDPDDAREAPDPESVRRWYTEALPGVTFAAGGEQSSLVRSTLAAIDRVLAEEPIGNVRLVEIPPRHAGAHDLRLSANGDVAPGKPVTVADVVDRLSPDDIRALAMMLDHGSSFGADMQAEVDAGRWSSWSATHRPDRHAVVVTAELACGCQQKITIADADLIRAATPRMALKAAEARAVTKRCVKCLDVPEGFTAGGSFEVKYPADTGGNLAVALAKRELDNVNPGPLAVGDLVRCKGGPHVMTVRDASDPSGRVWCEWQNVTGGRDRSLFHPDWLIRITPGPRIHIARETGPADYTSFAEAAERLRREADSGSSPDSYLNREDAEAALRDFLRPMCIDTSIRYALDTEAGRDALRKAYELGPYKRTGIAGSGDWFTFTREEIEQAEKNGYRITAQEAIAFRERNCPQCNTTTLIRDHALRLLDCLRCGRTYEHDLTPYWCFTCHVNLRNVEFIAIERHAQYRSGHYPKYDAVNTCGRSECKPRGPEFEPSAVTTIRTTGTVSHTLADATPGQQRKVIRCERTGHTPVGTLAPPGDIRGLQADRMFVDDPGAPPPRPDGFSQEKIDALKTMMLATKGGKK